MFDHVPVHYGGLHESHSPDSQRPFPSPTAVNQRLIKVLASSNGGDNWTTVDLGDARSGQMVKERLLSKLDIPSNFQSLYSVYRHQGDIPSGPPLSDELIVEVCQMYGDSAMTLHFSVKGPIPQASLRSTPMSTPASLNGSQQSGNPQSLIHMQSLYQMKTQTPIDFCIPPINSFGTSIDYLSPPLSNLMPPVLSMHPRTVTSGLNHNPSNGYMNQLDQACDDQWQYTASQQTLATKEAETQINLSNIWSLPGGLPSLHPNILLSSSPPPSSTVATGDKPTSISVGTKGNGLPRHIDGLPFFPSSTAPAPTLGTSSGNIPTPVHVKDLTPPPPNLMPSLMEMNSEHGGTSTVNDIMPTGVNVSRTSSCARLGPAGNSPAWRDSRLASYPLTHRNRYFDERNSPLHSTSRWNGESLFPDDHETVVLRGTDSSFHSSFPNGKHEYLSAGTPDAALTGLSLFEEGSSDVRTNAGQTSAQVLLPNAGYTFPTHGIRDAPSPQNGGPAPSNFHLCLPPNLFVGPAQWDTPTASHPFLESCRMDVIRPTFYFNATPTHSTGMNADTTHLLREHTNTDIAVTRPPLPTAPRDLFPDGEQGYVDRSSMPWVGQAGGYYTHEDQKFQAGSSAPSFIPHVSTQDAFVPMYWVGSNDVALSASSSTVLRENPTLDRQFRKPLSGGILGDTELSRDSSGILGTFEVQQYYNFDQPSSSSQPGGNFSSEYIYATPTDYVPSTSTTATAAIYQERSSTSADCGDANDPAVPSKNLHSTLFVHSSPNGALAHFLQLVKTSVFIRSNALEPSINSKAGQNLLGMVLNQPECPPIPRRDHKQSIYILMVDYSTKKCLMCGKTKGSLTRAIDCIRVHLDHRPFVCGGKSAGCLTCGKKPMPARFYSSSLLNDHIKGQIKKTKCVHPNCGGSFRRGGLRRHWNSMHKDAPFPSDPYTKYRSPKSRSLPN